MYIKRKKIPVDNCVRKLLKVYGIVGASRETAEQESVDRNRYRNVASRATSWITARPLLPIIGSDFLPDDTVTVAQPGIIRSRKPRNC